MCIRDRHIIEGLAPEAMRELPPATHVFIGGSAGNMEAIVEAALTRLPENKEAASEKNAFDLADCGNHKPAQVRFVINCIALESTAQALACAKKYGCGAPEVTPVSYTHLKHSVCRGDSVPERYRLPAGKIARRGSHHRKAFLRHVGGNVPAGAHVHERL